MPLYLASLIIQFWSGFIPVNGGGRIYPTLTAISPAPTLHLARFKAFSFSKSTLLYMVWNRLEPRPDWYPSGVPLKFSVKAPQSFTKLGVGGGEVIWNNSFFGDVPWYTHQYCIVQVASQYRLLEYLWIKVCITSVCYKAQISDPFNISVYKLKLFWWRKKQKGLPHLCSYKK